MIYDLGSTIILQPTVAQCQVHSEPYCDVSLYTSSDYYVRRGINSLLHMPPYSRCYSGEEIIRDGTSSVMIAAVTRRLNDMYRRNRAWEIEVKAKERFQQLQNIFSDLGATLNERRRSYRYANFDDSNISQSEVSYLPFIKERCVNDQIQGRDYVKSDKRASRKHERFNGSSERSNKKKSHFETKSASKLKESKLVEKQNIPKSLFKTKCADKPKESKLAEKSNSEQLTDHSSCVIDCVEEKNNAAENHKLTKEAIQFQITNTDAGSGFDSCDETESLYSIQSEPISETTSDISDRCPSIEEVEDEEFKA